MPKQPLVKNPEAFEAAYQQFSSDLSKIKSARKQKLSEFEHALAAEKITQVKEQINQI